MPTIVKQRHGKRYTRTVVAESAYPAEMLGVSASGSGLRLQEKGKLQDGAMLSVQLAKYYTGEKDVSENICVELTVAEWKEIARRVEQFINDE